MVIHVFSPSTLEIHYHSQLKPCFIETIETTRRGLPRAPRTCNCSACSPASVGEPPGSGLHLPSVSARLRHPLTHNHLWQAPCSSLHCLYCLIPISMWTPCYFFPLETYLYLNITQQCIDQQATFPERTTWKSRKKAKYIKPKSLPASTQQLPVSMELGLIFLASRLSNSYVDTSAYWSLTHN